MADDCPRCAARARVVTAVTIRPLGSNPRSVLVTRFCTSAPCSHKYTVLKLEGQLTPEERAAWQDAGTPGDGNAPGAGGGA